MKRIHLLPNIITAFGLSCGLFVIFKMTMTEVGHVDMNVLASTAGILLFAAIADLLDGWTARMMKAESEFGGFFDSLADAISFGVAPSVIVLKTLSVQPGTGLSFLLTGAVMLFSVSGVLRLVRFNVISQLAKEDLELRLAHKKNFTGLPIPAAAAAAVSANLFFASGEFRYFFAISEASRAFLLFSVMSLLGYLMICRLKFPSLKTLQLRVASFRLVLLTVLFAVIIFYGVLHYFSVIFFLFSWAYVTIALILSFVRILSGKKSKTLEDFEPEPEEEELQP